MVAAALAALALSASAASTETSWSLATTKEMARIEEAASVSPAARRLFAATRDVPRREARGTGYPDAIATRRGASPAVVLDSTRSRETTESEALVEYVLALARAELAFPLPVVEAEQAAWTRTLMVLVEVGAEDPKGFGARLAAAAKAEAARSAALERSRLPAGSPWEPTETPALRLPDSALARAGLLLHYAETDPDRLWWTIESGAPWPAGSARLAELEDLFALRAKEIAALKAPPEGPYAVLGGKRYRGPLVAAAWRLRGAGEVERLRESLDGYDVRGLAALKTAANRFRRATGTKP